MNRLMPQAHWLLRIALASVFLFHGLSKYPNLAGLAQMLNMPTFMIFMVATAETLGGLLVLLGGGMKDWMTRLGALMLVPVMLGAIFMVHWPRWSFTASDTRPLGGMEFQVVLLLVSLYLFVKGNSINAG